MKYLVLFFGLVACNNTSTVTSTQINSFEYYLECGSCLESKPLLDKAKELCGGAFTIKSQVADKYGDVEAMHISCGAL